jgi:hypothetical protein
MERLVKTCEDVQLHQLARNVTFSGNTVLLVNQMGFDAIRRQNNSTPNAGLARIRSEPSNRHSQQCSQATKIRAVVALIVTKIRGEMFLSHCWVRGLQV